MMCTVSGWGDGGSNDSCNGEQISELHAITATTSHTETGSLYDGFGTDDDNDYYYFTPGTDGTLTITGYTSTYNTDLYISTLSCNNNQVLNNGTSYSSPTAISITSSTTVYIRIKRERNNATTNYSLPITFTAAAQTPPIIGDIPNQAATVGSSLSLSIASYVTPTNGDAITSYSLTGTLPTGLNFNSATGILSGTPMAVTASTTLSVVATDNDGDSNSDSFTITVSAAPADSTGGRDFSLRKNLKLRGDVVVIGNTVLCEKNISGACIEPTGTYNNYTNLQMATSSYSTLVLPANAVVRYARLYWQGRLTATSSSTAWSSTQKTNSKTISLRQGSSGAFTSISADFGDFAETISNNYVKIYSAGADVTEFVKNSGAGTYYIDNFYTETGETDDKNPSDGLGAYGAWVLAVIYEDSDSTAQLKDVTIFDGYKVVADLDNDDIADPNEIVEISVTGFYAPKAPALVNSKVYAFSGEGDANIVGDKYWMRGGSQVNYTELGTFNSRIDVSGSRSPNLTNNSGIDIHTYNVGTAGGGLGLIGNEERTAWMKFTTTSDTFMPSVAIFSTDLYAPDICYDYAFSQNNRFFPHDGSPIAHIHGYLLNNEPLSAQIMFRNRESGSEAKNLTLFIDEMDSTNQLEFYTDTQLELKKTLPESYYYVDVTAGDILMNTMSDLKFNWITSTAVLGYNESVFAAFKLNPLVSGQIDVPLNMYVSYDYTLDNVTYTMPNLRLDEHIERCVPSPTVYNPVEWIFNVVDSGLNPGAPTEGVTNVKYNLPTQVASRPVDIKVVSFDPTQLDRVKAISGMVAVELIDVSGYLDTESSCDDPNSAFTPRAWLELGDVDQNVTAATLTSANFNTGLNEGVTLDSFFGQVRENVAYRVSYNLADDNGSIIFDRLEGGSGPRYHLSNFPSYGGGVCAIDMDGNANSQDMIPQYCGDAGTSYASGMTPLEVRTCMECIYGLKTRSVCSRDNFSIKPEGFNIKITDPLNSASISSDANIAAGYFYRFDVNATNHGNGSFTPGYSVWFNSSTPDRNVSLSWEPNGRVVIGCNDITTPLLDFYFANGRIIAQDRNHANVGRYELKMRDSLWTFVDQTPMLHHDNNTNWVAGSDCANGSAVPLYVSGGNYYNNMVGCQISSNHTKLSAPTATYNDYNLIFRPDHFNLSGISMTTGLSHTNSAINNLNAWLYINDINGLTDDERMSLRYSGQVIAEENENNNSLSNFVADCYAEPINLSVNLVFPADVNTTMSPFVYRLQELNTTAPLIWRDTNATITNPTTAASFPIVTIPQDSFLKNRNGLVDANLSINFGRNTNMAVNPITLGLQNLQAGCQTVADCSSVAHGNSNHTPDANLTTNSTVTFLYGRTHASRQRYAVPADAPYNANIYFESFCFGNEGGNACNKNVLPNGLNSRRVDDTRWFWNENHDIADDGAVGIVLQRGGANTAADIVDATDNPIGNPSTTTLDYDSSRGFPYKTTMENGASPWLIYNESDPTATRNEFQVEFDNQGGWTGKHETNTTTKSTGGVNTNRRIMW
ncbi:MAG: hypothetical protein A3K14_08755 [Sulfurimonas sp. RIFCSPLOWO2_12_FULL_36_74]|nr:MAG: hypothetical protein A3J26_00950 [Sulfurimonas sp. RIFCSPLOWO2_02_FULL_36_28]OHE07396.1 MAG: hypothetical protein A3K14_08755 [Sulfurimonas sp. RIFCSPLOWO2_12_FULL_36_74]